MKLGQDKNIARAKILREFAQAKISDAKAKGANYGPWEYFKDYREIIDKEALLPFDQRWFDSYQHILELNAISMSHFREGKHSWDDVEKARKYYNIGHEGLYAKNADKFTLNNFLHWCLVFYYRSLILSLILYLIRMCSRKGILETILADKKRFFMSVVLWPLFITRYPHNVVREIILEAELRRIGSLWRKLDPREKRLVQKIASRSKTEYRKWISDFETKHAHGLKRSFEWALVGTVLVLLSQTVTPISVNAEMRNTNYIERGKVYDEYDTHMNSPGDNGNSFSPDNTPVAWVEKIFIPPVLCLTRKLEILFERLKLKEFARSVFKIPVDGYLVEGMQLVQTK